jgi:membrane protein implicated in regulation of membrane protease activity
VIPQPPLPPVKERSVNNAATFTALLLLAACAGGLFFLVAVINPFALGILVIGFLFVPVVAMHYLVWGRWLQECHREEELTGRQPLSLTIVLGVLFYVPLAVLHFLSGVRRLRRHHGQEDDNGPGEND